MRIYLFLISLAFGLNSLAYECDEGVLNSTKSLSVQKADSKNFKARYDKAYEDQEKSITGLKSKISPERDARSFYFETRLGIRHVQYLEKLRQDFHYDAVTAHLIDDEMMSPTPTHFTSTTTVGSKKYFIQGKRVVAVLDQLSKEQYRLTKLDRYCNRTEVAGFNSLSEQSDSRLDYKITPELCPAVLKSTTLPSEEETEKASAFIGDRGSSEVAGHIKDSCRFLSSSSGAAKPAARKSTR